MGVSVSTSLAIVFAGSLIAFTGFYAAAANSIEYVQDANEDHDAQLDTVQETAINVTTAEVLSGAAECTVQVNVTNAGSTELAVNDTDVLVDGEYKAGWRSDTRVDGDEGTRLWMPGERLTLNVTEGLDSPARAKVVTGPGVAAVEPIEGGSTQC